MRCWECEVKTEEVHHHHVVPRSRGGTKTVPLCLECHAKAHHRKKNMSTSALIKEGMRKAALNGSKFGNPNIAEARKIAIQDNIEKGVRNRTRIMDAINEIRDSGVKGLANIARCLNARGITTSRGKRFTVATVHYIIRRETSDE